MTYVDSQIDDYLMKDGDVEAISRADGSFDATCRRCGAATGASAYVEGDDYGDDLAIDSGLDDFIDDHRACGEPIVVIAKDDVPEDMPSPAVMPTETRRSKTVWVIKQASGGNLRVLAEWHISYARPDGEELRFYVQDGEARNRVATVRAGSWHWCVAESALEPESEEP